MPAKSASAWCLRYFHYLKRRHVAVTNEDACGNCQDDWNALTVQGAGGHAVSRPPKLRSPVGFDNTEPAPLTMTD